MNNYIQHRYLVHNTDKVIIVHCMDILYSQGEGAYAKIHMAKGGQLTVSKSLGTVSKELAHPYFIRISQSLLINSYHIRHIYKKERRVEMANGRKLAYTIPLNELIERLKHFSV